MTFTSRTTGKTYPETEFGALRAARDEWDVKARNRGHAPAWKRIAKNAYEGTCGQCGAGVTCGAAWSSSAGGPDLRTGPCRDSSIAAGDRVRVTRRRHDGGVSTWEGRLLDVAPDGGFSFEGVNLATGTSERSYFSDPDTLQRMYGCTQTVQVLRH